MNLTAEKVADELDRTAGFLLQHAADTTRRVHDLALGHTASNGPGPRNQVSDPTGETAVNPPDMLAGLETRWLTAIDSLERCYLIHCDGRTWQPAHAQAKSLAVEMRAGRIRRPQDRTELHAICCELDHVIYETMPFDREAAHEKLLEERHANLMRAFPNCLACESPVGESKDDRFPSTTLKGAGGLCHPGGCYDMQQKRIQRGRYVDDVTFIAEVKAGVARGELYRPASPLWRTAVPTIHEGEAS